jgi:exopolysaccharide production protein ExoZ
MTVTSETQRLGGVQALRGLAALAVAISHLDSLDARFLGGDLMPIWSHVGFAGVDLFFVISGFVMVHVAGFGTRGVKPAALFAASRAIRIYSLWWVVLVPLIAVYFYRPDWVFASIPGDPDLVKSFFLWPDVREPLLATGWTLVHELWFYSVFAILLLFPRWLLLPGLVAWGGAVAASLVLGYSGVGSPEQKLITNPLTFEFLMGCAAAWLAREAALRKIAPWAVLVGLGWLGVAAMTRAHDPDSVMADSVRRMLLFGPPFTLIVFGVASLDIAGSLRSGGWLSSLGEWSYALYLVHVPVFAAMARLIAPYAAPGVADNALWWALMLGASILAAWILHRIVERPVLKGWSAIRRRLSRGRAIA